MVMILTEAAISRYVVTVVGVRVSVAACRRLTSIRDSERWWFRLTVDVRARVRVGVCDPRMLMPARPARHC